MTKENYSGSLTRSGPGPDCGHGRGYGYSHSHGQGLGSGSGRGRGHGQGRVPGGKAFGGPGRGRGRASHAIFRSEQFSGSNAGSIQGGGDSAPSSTESMGSLTGWPRKQSPRSGLHELLMGHCSRGRGYTHTNKNTGVGRAAAGSTNRRGSQLSWADMRRQSQRSNSTADDSSEPDGSHRTSQNVCSFYGGGWGGRGRGRLLDPSSVKKPGNDEDTSAWSGKGRGGILFVPGVNFHNVRNSAGWKYCNTGHQGMLNSRNSVGGHATNYAVQSSHLFTKKEDVMAHSGRNKYQMWKKTRKDKECSSVAKADNCSSEEVTDTVSSAEDDDKNLLYQRKQSDVNNIEENLQKQLLIKADDSVHVEMQKNVVTVNCPTEQKSDENEYRKCEHFSPHGGRTRGIVPFGGSLFTIEGAFYTQNINVCGKDIEEKPSDP